MGSNRPGTVGDGDFWRVTRASTSDPWGPVENIASINTIDNENMPELSSDGIELFFSSNRPGSSGEDVWRATRDTFEAPWSPAVRVAELSSATLDRGVSLWNNDSRSSPRSGTSVYSSTRRSKSCAAPSVSTSRRAALLLRLMV